MRRRGISVFHLTLLIMDVPISPQLGVMGPVRRSATEAGRPGLASYRIQKRGLRHAPPLVTEVVIVVSVVIVMINHRHHGHDNLSNQHSNVSAPPCWGFHFRPRRRAGSSPGAQLLGSAAPGFPLLHRASA